MSPELAKFLGIKLAPTLADRLHSFKMRTLLTALLGFGFGFLALKLFGAPLARISAATLGMAFGQTEMPALHVPFEISSTTSEWLPQSAFLSVGGLTIIGFSNGVFGRVNAKIVMLLPLSVGLASLMFLPDSNGWLNIFPGKLEMAIMRGKFDQADRLLKTTKLHQAQHQYLQAQIALRSKDTLALHTYGESVLLLADQWAYRQIPNGDLGTLQSVVNFRPEVIYALDHALNGSPQTHVGMEWQRQSHGILHTWIGTIVQLVLATLSLLTSAMLFKLWDQMRNRIRLIQDELEQRPL
ncbi:hypothetical protein [Undibacterium curvum]|uniref:hypothetical protein n=1 Tax=Undibacterium curvum TaxID=2762294 RepID=UPI003D1188EF